MRGGEAGGDAGRATDELSRRLARWVEAGLISREQAERIAAAEAAVTPVRKVSPLTEALAYAGAVLLVGAGVAFLGQAGIRLSAVGWVVVLAVAAAACLAGGWMLRRSTEPAIRRLHSVLWFVSTAAFAAFLGVVFGLEVDVGRSAVLVVSAGTAAYALVLWLVRRSAPQLLALWAGTASVIGGAFAFSSDPPRRLVALVVWAFGMAWFGLAWTGRLAPPRAALGLGAVTALAAGWIAIGQDGGGSTPVALALGLSAAALVATAGAKLRRTWLIVLGALAGVAFVSAGIGQYLVDVIGTAASYALAGAVFLCLAALTVALGRRRT
jgi:hypothetical protein